MDELQQTWRTVIQPIFSKYGMTFPEPFFTPLPTQVDVVRIERDVQQQIDNFGIDIRDLFSCLANGITDGPRRGGKPLDLKRLFWGLLNSCFKEGTLPALLRHLREVGVVVARQTDDIPERERPELPRYADYVFRQGCELYDLEHGPCEDVARKQLRIEELKARIESISKDCTTMDGNHGTNKPETGASIAKSRKDRALLRGRRLCKENSEITIDEIIEDPLVLQIWPSKERPKPSTLRRIFEGSGITKRGRRKADKKPESR